MFTGSGMLSRHLSWGCSRLQSNPAADLDDVPVGKPIEVTLKVAGVHWWYRSRSHASELTAGYYNSDTRDGYNSIIEMCARHGVAMTLTCVEMCDAQHPPEALCGPRRPFATGLPTYQWAARKSCTHGGSVQ